MSVTLLRSIRYWDSEKKEVVVFEMGEHALLPDDLLKNIEGSENPSLYLANKKTAPTESNELPTNNPDLVPGKSKDVNVKGLKRKPGRKPKK